MKHPETIVQLGIKMCSFQKVFIDLIKAMTRNTAVTVAIVGTLSTGFGFVLSYVIDSKVSMRLICEALTDWGESADDLKFIQSRELKSKIDALYAHDTVVDDDLKMRDRKAMELGIQYNALSLTMEEVKADVKKLLSRK